jgi:hypothetical protein
MNAYSARLLLQSSFVVLCSLAGCGSGGGASPMDLAMPDLYSACGHPGDVGNSLGVGRYCLTSADCAQTSMARVCSSAANGTELTTVYSYFCTIVGCNPTAMGTCGESATCACTCAGCGCAPVSCAALNSGGCSDLGPGDAAHD